MYDHTQLVRIILKSLNHADVYASKLTSRKQTDEPHNVVVDGLHVLTMDGMSGQKTRCFYNNLCSYEGIAYLEIGTWKGSSLCAAMFENSMYCVAIDNWSEFGGPEDVFRENFRKYKGANDAHFIPKNCWDVDVNEEPALTRRKFNVYMYDGNHEEESHYNALLHYLPCLAQEFVYLVDDWNWRKVQEATLRSIRDNECEIMFSKTILTTPDGTHPQHHKSRQHSDWHNGICMFVLRQKQTNTNA